MRAFVAAVVCAVVIGGVAAYALGELRLSSENVYATSNVRLGD